MRVITLSIPLLLAGCASLPSTIPADVRLETVHISHISQHFGPKPTNYGFQAVEATAEWRSGGFHVSFSEGLNISPKSYYGYGGLDGPRELTEVRIGYTWHPGR